MHIFLEPGTPVQSDSAIQALSWMGKVPDDIPEVSHFHYESTILMSISRLRKFILCARNISWL